jgi:LexA DNA binding domain-containing protein
MKWTSRPSGRHGEVLALEVLHHLSEASGVISCDATPYLVIPWLLMKGQYTEKQGQYLAFIYYYGKIHRCSPSEAEMQEYFRVSPPSVHQMILTLERCGLIERTPMQARSIRLLIPREELPDLD